MFICCFIVAVKFFKKQPSASFGYFLGEITKVEFKYGKIHTKHVVGTFEQQPAVRYSQKGILIPSSFTFMSVFLLCSGTKVGCLQYVACFVCACSVCGRREKKNPDKYRL